METRNLVIIGSGPAGYTAAIYAARAGLNPVLFSGMQPGGQLTITSEVENWPGEPDGILGGELMENMRKQALRFGTEIVDDVVSEISGQSPFTVKTSKQTIQARAVIVATGASAMWLGVPGEDRLQGKGISACATCDGFFFRGKDIVVAGGGDSAMEEATFLTRFAKTVTLVHRREEFRASKAMIEKAKNDPKISFALNTVIEEVLGEDHVTGLRVKDLSTGEGRVIPCEGLFVAIGHKPKTEVFKGFLELDEKGYIVVTPGSTVTSIPGIFACGDVADHVYRQAIVAAGSGSMAALDAERWLDGR